MLKKEEPDLPQKCTAMGQELHQEKCQQNIRSKKTFVVSVGKQVNRFPREAVDS